MITPTNDDNNCDLPTASVKEVFHTVARGQKLIGYDNPYGPVIHST